MNLHQIEAANEYVRYLKENSGEVDLLFKELLISVTSFFRDPEAWEAIEAHLKELITSRPADDRLRCWVPGCATGEEAYSLAILISELLEQFEAHRELQIFGTDLDFDAIEIARRGVFPKGIAADIPLERLERYLVHDADNYTIRKQIREKIVFSVQNVISDPPFTRLDLISCRNLMIYLNANLQQKLLSIFHYALRPGGLMMLGPSETVGTHDGLFQLVDKRWKIYRRLETPGLVRTVPKMSKSASKMSGDADVPVRESISLQRTQVAALIERLLRDRFVPICVVVNEQGQILYIHGRTGSYLEPSEGEPANNIFEMAREGLRIELSSALRECISRNMPVKRENIRVRSTDRLTHVNLTVEQIREPEALHRLILVSFRPVHLPSSPDSTDVESTSIADEDNDRVLHLERELRYLKESFRAADEELETSNEELKSANEELQSTNEELQSANEELETSKEEMESLNEELSTVNAELNIKVEELSHANDDMQNLLNSTQIGTIFLDNELNIKRFTKQANQIVNLRQSDEGRPISDLVTNLQGENLTEDCREVLRTLVPKEKEVRTVDGLNYLLRVLPYRTENNAIHGLVVTFVGIDRLVKAEANLSFFRAIVETIRHPLVVLDEELTVVAVNEMYCNTFHTNRDESERKLIYELDRGVWNIPELRTLLDEILPQNASIENYEVNGEFPGIGHRRFILNARRLQRRTAFPSLILLGIEEISKS